MGHDSDEEARIDVQCMRETRESDEPRFTWDYRVFARDGTTIIDKSDSGGASYDSEKLAYAEGWRTAKESLDKMDR